MKRLVALFAALVVLPATGFSFAHLWKIQEVYSNSDGSVQFIELFTSTGSNEIFMTNSTLRIETNGVTQNTMTFSNATASDGSGDLPSGTPGGTLNKTILIGTANLTALYGVTPDYFIPANFFSPGTLNNLFFKPDIDRDAVNLTNLPTNGVMSLDGLVNNSGTTAAATAVNSQATPKNFAGNTFMIPEPAGAILVGAGLLVGALVVRNRRGLALR